MTNSVVDRPLRRQLGRGHAARPWPRRASGWSRPGPRSLVVAPGLIERPYVFEGNDLPGVMLSTAVRRLDQPLRRQARRAGGRLHRQRRGRRRRRRTSDASGSMSRASSTPAGGDASCAPRATAEVLTLRGVRRRRRDRVRPAGHGRRLDRADVAAQHGRRPAGLSTTGGPLLPRRACPDERAATGGIAGDGTLDELLAHARGTGREAAGGLRGSHGG